MATKILNFKDAVPTGATLHRSLTEGSVTAATSGTGWELNQKASAQSCIQNGGSEVARTDGQWGATLQPAAAPSQTIGDCWRTEDAYSGYFLPANWVLALGFISVTSAYNGRWRVRCRVWKSKDPNGVGAIELTASMQLSNTTTADMTLSTDTVFTITWAPGVGISLDGEYLFFQFGCEIVTTAGNNNTHDALWRVTSGTYKITTPDFVAKTTPAVHRSQPRHKIGIKSKWRKRGLTFAWSAATPAFEHARGLKATDGVQTSGVPINGNRLWRSWSPNAVAQDGVKFGAVQPITDGNNFSIAVLAAPTDSAVKTVLFSQRTAAGSFEQIDFIRGTNGLISAGSKSFELYWRTTAGNPYYAENDPVAFALDGKLHLYGCQNNNNVLDVLRDGVIVTGTRTAPSGTATSAVQKTAIGNLGDYTTDGQYANICPIFAVYVFNGHALTPTEWAELTSDPMDVWEEPTDYITFTSGLGTITISEGITEADDTLVSTVTSAEALALSVTEADDTLTSTVMSVEALALSVTEADDTLAFTVTSAEALALFVTEADDTLTSTVTSVEALALSVTEANDTLASTVTSVEALALSVTEADDTLASVVTSAEALALSVTEADDTLTSTVTSVEALALSVTEADDTLTSTVLSVEAFTLSVTEADDTLVSTVLEVRDISEAVTEADDTLTSTVLSVEALALSVTEADDTLASTVTSVEALALNVTEADDTLASVVTDAGVTSLNLTITEVDDVLESALLLAESLAGATLESDDVVASTLTVPITLSVDITEANDGVVAVLGSLTDLSAVVAEADDVIAAALKAAVVLNLSVTEEYDALIARLLGGARALGSICVSDSLPYKVAIDVTLAYKVELTESAADCHQ